MQAPLADVLGATWTLDASVTSLAWNGGHAAFALSDGTVAIARAGWQGAPALRPREGGGVELLPADGPPPPLSRAAVSRGPCLAVAAWRDGFLAGCADGRLRRLDGDGTAERLQNFTGRPVTLVAANGRGWACVAGGALHIDAQVPIAGLSGVTALVPRADTGVVVAHDRGVAMVGRAGPEILTDRPCARLALDPVGIWLAMDDRLLRLADRSQHALPGAQPQPQALAFSRNGGAVAQAGSTGARVWHLAHAPTSPVEVSRTAALAVAFHPSRPLLAIAHAGGAVTLGEARPGETLLIRPPGSAPTHSLAFDTSGTWLAMGGVDCALVHLPALLFRADQTEQR